MLLLDPIELWEGGASAPVSAPSAVDDLAATSRPNGRVALSWTAPAGSPTGYRVYRGTVTGVTSGTGTLVTTTAALGFEDTGLTPGSDYYYVVVAYNVAGDAADSNEATAAAGAVVASEASVRRRLRRRYH